MFIGKMAQGATQMTFNVLKPFQYLLVRGSLAIKEPYGLSELPVNSVYNALRNVKCTIRHTNSQTSYTRELVPSMDLLSLMQICTIEEGFAKITPRQDTEQNCYAIDFELPIKLSPDGAVSLNNNSYLSCDVRVDNVKPYASATQGDIYSVGNFDLYGIEGKTVNSTKVMLYTRYFIPKGELQRQFDFTTQKAVYLDHRDSSLVDVLMPCVGGSTPIYTPVELGAISRLQNDLVAVGSDCYTPVVSQGEGSHHDLFINFGGATLTKILLVTAQSAREVISMTIKVDGTKTYTFYTADFYDITTGSIVVNRA